MACRTRRQGNSKALPGASSMYMWLTHWVDGEGMEPQGENLEEELGCNSVHQGLP